MVQVSATIPVYNQAEYVGEAIQSVLAQTYRDFELIVVDDGSTDDTPEVVSSYGSRIRSLRQPNRGGAAALNAGIRAARAPWIAWLSADDLWEPTKLERQIDAIRQFPDVGLVYTDYVYIDPTGTILSAEHFPCPRTKTRTLLWLLLRCYINGSSTLIRREVFDRVGDYDENNRLTPDWDMWLRIAQAYRIAHVPEPLVRYRIHPNQTSAKREIMERSAKRTASRALRRLGPVLGGAGAILRFKKEIRNFPAHVRSTVGGRTISRQLREVLETAILLVNPETAWLS